MKEMPPDPSAIERCRDKERTIVENVPVRSDKFQAPTRVEPQGRFPDPSAFIAEFAQTRESLTQIARENPEWLHGRCFEHPFLKDLDGYQWLLLASTHGLRHTAQIREIKERL